MNGFHFPLFVDLSHKRVVVVGAGRVATRRVKVLEEFGAVVTVIAPVLTESFVSACWLARPYATGDLEGAVLAVAATDDRSVNHQVGVDAGALHIPVSVADCPEECTFFFPAVCVSDDVAAGVISRGNDHRKTAAAAYLVRQLLEEL